MSNARLEKITVEPGGDMTIQNGNVLFTYTTPSTSVLTGAIIVSGGIAINNTSDAGSSTSGGALTVGGGIAVFKKTLLGGDLKLDSNASTLSVNGISTERMFLDTVSNKQFRIAPDGVTSRLTLTDTRLTVNCTQQSTSSTDGGLVLLGGASVNKNLFVVGDSYIKGTSTGANDVSKLILGPVVSTTDYSSASEIRSTSSSGTDNSTTLEFYTHQATAGTVGTLRLSIDNVGDIKLTSQTNAVDVSTGALVLSGGISTNRKSYMGDQLMISSNYIGDTGAHLILSNSGSDISGVDRDARLQLHSKSSGQSVLNFRNTLDTTVGNMELSYYHSGNENGLLSFRIDASTELMNITTDRILTVYGTDSSTSSTSGTLQSRGGLGVEKRAFFKDLVHFDSTIELKGNTQVYNIIGGGDTSSGLSFTGKSGATSSVYNFFTSDGDNTDDVALKMFNLGLPNTVTNSESFEIQWDTASTLYRLSSKKSGTGVNRPINIESGIANQLVVGTGGNISIGAIESAFKLNVNGTLNASGAMTITQTNNATDLSTGALQVEGGVSINKNVVVGGKVLIGNGSSTQYTNNDILVTFDTENPWSIRQSGTGGSADLVLKSEINARNFMIRDSSDTSRFTFLAATSGSVLTISGIQVIDATNIETLLVRKAGDTGDVFNVNTSSDIITSNARMNINSTNIEALQVRTGSRDVFIVDTTNNNVEIASTIDSTSNTSGALQVGGGVGILKHLSVGDNITIMNSTGGGNIIFNDTAHSIYGRVGYDNTTDVLDFYEYGTIRFYTGGLIGSQVKRVSISNTGVVDINGQTIIDTTNVEALLVRKASDTGDIFSVNTSSGIVNVWSTVESSSATIGSLVVGGGMGVLKNISIGGNIDTLGPLLHRGTTDEVIQFYDNTNTKRWGNGKNGSNVYIINRYNTSGIFQEQSIGIDNITGKTTFANTSSSSSLVDAALIISGGISSSTTQNASSLTNGGGLTLGGGASINKKLYVGGDSIYSSTTQSTDSSSGSVILSGGLGVGKNLYVGGNTVITGNLTVQGTTTTISTSQTLITDNIQVFNSGPAGTSDSGFLVDRYQLNNDTGSGDTVNDSPSISQTFPSQLGASSTEAILHASASGVNNYYKNWWIKITSGFSANQVRRITSYDGSTKKVTVTAWTTQNPAGGDTFRLYNKPLVGVIYNEIADRFHFTGTDTDPGVGGTINYTDEIDVYMRNLTLTGTVESSSLSLAGLKSSGGASFSNTTDATSITSGGSLTLGGGASVGKSLIVGTNLTVNGTSITPNIEDIYTQKTFTGAQSASNVNVTDFAFTNGVTGAFDAWVYVKIIATSNLYANYNIHGVQRGSDWDIVQPYVGDSTGVTFSITTGGQIRYSSSAYSGFVSLTIKFRASTITV